MVHTPRKLWEVHHDGKRSERLDATAGDFHQRFHRFFCRSEGRQWEQEVSDWFVVAIERKNVENIAEEVGAPPRKLRSF